MRINWDYVLNYRPKKYRISQLEERIGEGSRKSFKKLMSQLDNDEGRIKLYEETARKNSFPTKGPHFTFEGNLLATSVREFKGYHYCYDNFLKHPSMPDPDLYMSWARPSYYVGVDNSIAWLESCTKAARKTEQKNGQGKNYREFLLKITLIKAYLWLGKS